MTGDFRDDITKDTNCRIIGGKDGFYHKDPSLVEVVQKLMNEGKKFLATKNFRYGPDNVPVLIASRGGALYFEEGVYMIGDNPIPQFVSPMKVNSTFTVFSVDFI